MEFGLSKEHLLAQQLYRSFAEKEVKPLAQELDEEEKFPWETVKKMARYGMLGIPIPKEYGGQGADVLTYIMAVEEMAKVCGTTAVIMSAHTSLCATPILENGTEEQKQKYLVPLAKGEKLGAFGLTEPGAGTDASMQQTKAVLEGDHYVLNGSKIFITNAEAADIFIVMAMTDKSKGTKGISAFIVEKDFPGFSVGPHEKKMGIRGSSTCELIFENCIVPKENMLGKEGKGFALAMKTLDGGRLGVAAMAIGLAQGCLDEAVKYSMERKQFGHRLADFQAISFKIAKMQTELEAARQLTYHAAVLKDANHPDASKACSEAKFFAAEMANRCAYEAVQIHGGYGYIEEYRVERMYRDARILSIFEGTSEIQQVVIANSLLRK